VKTCAQDGVKSADLIDADAIELLAERLRTALQLGEPAPGAISTGNRVMLCSAAGGCSGAISRRHLNSWLAFTS
jgi:hypothetical protein